MPTLDIKDIVRPEFGTLTTAHQMERDSLVGSGSTVYRWMNEERVDWCWIGGVRILVLTQRTKLYIANSVNRQGTGGRTNAIEKMNSGPRQLNEKQLNILKELDIEL